MADSIQQEQERLKLIQEQNEAAKELVSTYKKLKIEDKEILDISKQLSKASAAIDNSIQKRLDKTTSLKDLTKALRELQLNSIDFEKNNNKLLDNRTKALATTRQLAQQEAREKRSLLELEGKNSDLIIQRHAAERLGNEDIAKDLAKQIVENNRIIVQKEKGLQKTTQTKEEQKNLVKQLDESIKANEIISKELEKELELMKKQFSVQSLIKRGFDNITKSITLGAIFKSILDFALAADAQITELGKSLGISKDQARGLYQNFSNYAKSAGDSFVTTKKLMEAQSELTQELGVAGVYTGKQTEDFSRLTKLMGLSAQEAGKLARLSVINGKSIEETTKSVIKGSFAAERTAKASFDQRTILKEVANLSEGILIKFQGNPEALGAAVVQAKALGLSLNEVDKIGESLLNWESSIQNELEAELLTGKQINLEKARYASLTGDQATLTAEVAAQVGNLNDYSNMNVIAQKSLAQAFGMSRDEMSKMLMDQEKFNKLGDVSNMTLQQQLENLKAQGEPIDSVLYKQIQQQSIQEKFNNAMEKMQDIIGNLVAGPLGNMIEGFANLANHSGVIVAAMVALGAISLTKTLAGLATMAAELSLSAAGAIATASAITLGLGIVAVIAGIAAAMGAFDSAKTQSVEDGIAMPGRGPFTITDSFGATAITAAGDGLAVSPNISRGDSGSNSGVIAAISNLANIMTTTANRPAVAYINGKDAFAKDLGGASALGTSQTQGSYQLA